MLRILFTVILSMSFVIFIQLGADWMNLGHGLHPAVAFPLATMCLVGIGILLFIAYRIEQYKEYVNRKNLS